MKQQRISGKEAARVAEDMAKPGPIRVVAASEAQEAPGALVPSPGSELDRKAPPRVRKPLPRNDQWKAPTPDLEGHRKRLREALGNTLSDEFVDVILGKLVEALRPGLYDPLEEATLNAALAIIVSMQPSLGASSPLGGAGHCDWFCRPTISSTEPSPHDRRLHQLIRRLSPARNNVCSASRDTERPCANSPRETSLGRASKI